MCAGASLVLLVLLVAGPGRATPTVAAEASRDETYMVVDLRGAGHGKPPIRIVDQTSRAVVEVRIGEGTFTLDPPVGPGTSGRMPFPSKSRPCGAWPVTVRFDDGAEAVSALDPGVIRSITIRDEIPAE